MRKRVLAVVVAVGAVGVGAGALAPAASAQGVTVPPACLKVPLIGDLQLQVGYCPNG